MAGRRGGREKEKQREGEEGVGVFKKASVILTGHGKLLGFSGGVATLGAPNGLSLHILHSLPLDVVVTETHLAPEASVLTQSIAGGT